MALNMLRGLNGEYELGRVLLAAGTVIAIVSPVVFEAINMHHGIPFNPVEWCAAYPGGLAALIGAGAFAIGQKDVSVATAIQTRAGTTSPAKE